MNINQNEQNNTAITTFNNPEFGEVRIVEIDGEPWLVGKDVTTVLGYANASKALTDHVDDEDKLNNESLLSLGQRGGWLINESGLYSLVLSSKLPNAKKFKRWVTKEVLPSIRKTGGYTVQQQAPVQSNDKDKAALIDAKVRLIHTVSDLFTKAGISPEYQTLSMQRLLDETGVSIPRIALQGIKEVYDKTAIADKLGILSSSNKPHPMAVGAIISKIAIDDDEKEETPYYRNGHNGVDTEYTKSVIDKIKQWLMDNNYPTKILMSNGKYVQVRYR